MKNLAALSVLAFLLAAGCAAPSAGETGVIGIQSSNGAAEARKDLAAGHPRLKAYGLPHPATPQYAAILLKDYGVTYQQIAGCMVDHALTKYAESYNKVVLDYLTEKYGKDALQVAWEKAQREYEAGRRKAGN